MKPLPVAFILNRMLPDKKEEVLHGLAPVRYWVLREDTRADRVTFAHILAMLESMPLRRRAQNPVISKRL